METINRPEETTMTSYPTCATCGTDNVHVLAAETSETSTAYCICRDENYSRREVRWAEPERTVDLDLFGETRTVGVRTSVDHVAFIGGFVGTIGRGVARYATTLTLWRVTDDKPAHRGNTVVEATDGTVWQYHLGTVIRNRQAQIVGWADVVGVTNRDTQERVIDPRLSECDGKPLVCKNTINIAS